MAGHEAEARRPRSDKARNRTHILEVAEQFFAEEGVAGSMDAIAKRAGVGPGTLYRHFPSRDALLAALMQARIDQLTSRRDAIEHEQVDPVAALDQWLEALGEYLTAFDGLPEPLRVALSEEASPLAITCEGFITTTDHFLAAAQRGGGAQPWIRARDLFLGVLATAWARGATLADTSSAEALATILRSGWVAPGKQTAPAVR
jgi:AcrR family transcriptional regulator